MIDVEARVFVVCCVVNLIEEITAWLHVAGGAGNFAGWWKLISPLIEEVGVSAAICASRDVGNEALVQVDHIIEVLQCGHNRRYNC